MQSQSNSANKAAMIAIAGWAGKARSGLLIVLLLFQGCYYFNVAPEGTSHATHRESKTLHSYFWGLSEPRLEVKNCAGNGISEVTVSTNLGYTILTVLTLGIWMPMNVEWRCAKDPIIDDEIGLNKAVGDSTVFVRVQSELVQKTRGGDIQ